MKRLSVVIVSLCFPCTLVLAQQGNTNIKLPSLLADKSTHDFQPGRSLLRSPNLIPDLPQSFPFTIPDVPQLKGVPEPQFKFINGAVYISLTVSDQTIYIPMPGGGATGCLTLDPPSTPAKQ